MYRQPGANTVEVVDRVQAMLPQFEQELGPGARLHVLNDRSVSIAQAVRDVEITLGITVLGDPRDLRLPAAGSVR